MYFVLHFIIRSQLGILSIKERSSDGFMGFYTMCNNTFRRFGGIFVRNDWKGEFV
jgi:hypothetical protein